jgi:hypothetical protein
MKLRISLIDKANYRLNQGCSFILGYPYQC